MVSNPPDWMDVQFGISKASIDSIGDCTCGAQDCYTVSFKIKPYIRYHVNNIFKKYRNNIIYFFRIIIFHQV